MRLVLVLSVLCAVFCLATATNCTSQSKSQDGREACYLYHMVQQVDLGGQDEQTMNDVAMETPSDAAVALATKHANMSCLPSGH